MQFLREIRRLHKPWRVLNVTVNGVLKTITVSIGPEPGCSLRCPDCRQIYPGYKGPASAPHCQRCPYLC